MPVNLANEGHVLADLKRSTYCLERDSGEEGVGKRGGREMEGSSPMTATQGND